MCHRYQCPQKERVITGIPSVVSFILVEDIDIYSVYMTFVSTSGTTLR